MGLAQALAVLLFYGAVFAGVVALRQWARSDLERWLARRDGRDAAPPCARAWR
jgi:hypothetical protein